MKKTLFLMSTVIAVCAIFITSCNKQLDEPPPFTEKSSSIITNKLENPYSLVNMQKALDNLLGNQKSKLSASHYYVKFMPHNENDLSLLKQDTTLDLYPYPIDYEIIESSTTYVDPEVPDGEPTFQYASVPVGFEIPMVEYELLEELFIPEEIDFSNIIDNISVDDLVSEALRITDNLEEPEDETRLSSWRPAGTMKVWDDNFSTYVPIKHLKVRACRWFTTYTGITNSNGYYSCDGTFKREANYSLQFERYDFEIRDAWLSTANINGPKKKGNWDLNMYNDKKEFWATIFRATSHYYYDDIHNLRRPPQNSFWHTQLKLRAFYEYNGSSNGSHCPACRFLGLGSAIKIYNPQNESMEVYGTTIHEIAHASHWKFCGWYYNNGEDHMVESWARGVQWELTRMIYPPNLMGNYPSYFGDYTGVVEDMIDNISGYDQVSGYTIRQIEDALEDKWKWNDWRINIQNKYNNGTENNLESLFNYWHQ